MNGLLLADTAAEAINTVCRDTSEILQLVGWVLTVFKIAIPLIIIALGLIDLGKAAVSSKPEDIKKSATSLVWRLVGGIAIYFIPAIVMMVFGFVSGFRDATGKADWDKCRACIERPYSATCENAVQAAKLK